MTDIMYLIVGAIIGLVAGGVIIFLLPYGSLRGAFARTQNELAEEQAKNNELQNTLLSQQSTAYQSRQTLLAQQKRLEEELTRTDEQRVYFEQQCTDLKARYERDRQNHLLEATRLRDATTRTEQEKSALQKQFAQERVEWDRQLQSLLLQNNHIEDQLQGLQRDKSLVNARLEQQQEAWEGERLDLQVQINTLEDSVALYKARAQQQLPPDTAQLIEQLRVEANGEGERQRAVWEAERKSLREQVERLQAQQRRGGSEPTAQQPLLQPEHWQKEKQSLLQQLEQAHQLRRDLEEKMNARERQAEQERGALEAEIEQLMERFLRMHEEQ